MAGMLDDDQDEITGINVTPLVDVMLVLLIIFMVTANYVSSSSIGLNLPEAQTGQQSDASSTSMELMLDADANIYVDGKIVAFDKLSPLLVAAKTKFGDKAQALITADVLTPHGEVVKLIDLVRKNGIHEFALNVEVPASK